ncbi:ABC transporter ATP-binding protein [Sessilibacter corallicola]|uniref:ABC transporter ATP-binding protein n=1 Tax=Sessilibacter corallicola TaxID=2904075 RepID=A0ABQ0A7S4_9GAMM|nr:ABC transporter ATP-binding protein [Sessilibacter corallicola]
MHIIEARNINKTVRSVDGDLTIIESLDLNVEEGTSIAIVGASGSGKSTLLALLAGLDVPSSGQIKLAGDDITSMDEEGRAQVRAKSVGFVFQSFQLLPGLSALENVMLPLELHGVADAGGRAKTYLERVGLSHRINHYPKQLSGGEQQRVAIARAFASEPKVLFADEPTGNLDSATGLKVIELLFDLNVEQKTTLVLVTHEQRLADRCQRQITLSAGDVVSDLNSSNAAIGLELSE